MHLVLHVSILKRYITNGSDGTSSNIQPIIIDGSEEHEVEEIVVEPNRSKYK